MEKFGIEVGMSEGKMIRGKPRHKRKNITGTSFKETGCWAWISQNRI